MRTPSLRISLAAGFLGTCLAATSVMPSAHAGPPTRAMERLDRSPVAIATGDGVFVSWRMLGLDPQSIGFNVLRDGHKANRAVIRDSTNFADAGGSATSRYQIQIVGAGTGNGVVDVPPVWSQNHLDVPLDVPAPGVTPKGETYTYRANDASVGDLDGDGQYEIVLKWDPSNSKDNSQSGYTGNVYVDAYELDGTRLWRIDLGRNIRAGAHYTQFQVYDYDSDGRAEVTMKTADATVDGSGAVIGDPTADYRNASGYVLSGPEFLSVFDGRSGAVLDTVDYAPARGSVAAWGDSYGNRVDRFLAATAYLDGVHPSLIASRGYYTRTVVVAWDLVDGRLVKRWTFDSDSAGAEYRGQGNHNLSIADVDQDNRDEIVFGSMTLDDDGTVLYNTRLGHGDAMHLSDFDPARPGLEVFAAHETMSASGNRGATFRDARTGEVLWGIPATRDTGRATMADIDPFRSGAEGWAIGGTAAWDSRVGQLRNVDGTLVSETIPPANFVTWWDGDLAREITDHDYDTTTTNGVPWVGKWNPATQTTDRLFTATGTFTNNTTKGNPSLQADLFGDWREELVFRTEDSHALRIFSTTTPTAHRLRTLMHDPVYRLGVAWQNTAYNQPPHTSYYLGVGMEEPAAPAIHYTR